VFLDHCARLSGGELALLRLLLVLDVDAIVLLAEDGPFVAELRREGIAVEVVPMAEAGRGLRKERVRPGSVPLSSVIATASYTIRLAKRLRRLRPDLVHTNSLKSALYGGVAGRLARIPVVWHVRDRIASDYLPPGAVKLVRGAAKVLPAAVIANSEATMATLPPASSRGIRRVVPSPVIYDSVDATPQRTHVAQGTLRFGLVGRIAPWKGQSVFLEAFARAFPAEPHQAVIVGGPLFGEDEEEYERALHRQAAALGISDRVEFTGHVNDVPRVLRGLDVLVHASTVSEPFGQVILEGMVVGIPVVAANAGGPAEVADHNVNALLYPPGDAAALADCLVRLAADARLRARLGRAGRKRARDFAPERVATQVMGLYRTLLNTPGSAG
jgi:glycosyltransferase involved in cell wall biosynthesis